MQYRPFSKTGFDVSALGFGAMRLPVLDNDMRKIDEPKAIEMIRAAIDGGVNYIDTAYVYHGGTSEALVAKALKDGYRARVKVATKMPVWMVRSRADMDRFLDQQLRRLDDTTIEYYLLHSLDRGSWAKMRQLGVMRWAELQIKKGRIGHIGFSFHGGYDAFRDICDGYGWEFCQVQYNYMDTAEQAGRRGLQYAAAKGMAVIVMEPLKGGKLASPPEQVRAILDANAAKRSPAGWALQWLWGQPEVSLVLSGMSDLAQVRENLSLADAPTAPFSAGDHRTIERVRTAYNRIVAVRCTDCKYCQPCPFGVDIPRNFDLYNDGYRYGNFRNPGFAYWMWMKPDQRAANCSGCGACERKCPQRIAIRAELKKVTEAFARP